MKKILFFLAVVGLVLAAGCYQQVQTPTSQVPAPGNEGVGDSVVNTNGQDTSDGEVKEFTMQAKRFEFTPSKITVNKGDKVRITVTSVDVTHGFSLPDFGINKKLEPDAPVIIDFVADKKGTFEFKCNVPCGSGHKTMAGTLIVK